MLNKETENELKRLGFDVSKLIEAAKAEEVVSLEVPKLYTDDDKSTFGNNRFEEGKSAMGQILSKQLHDELGLNLEDGRKDINQVVKAYGEKILADANVEVDEKVRVLTEEKAALQGKVKSLGEEVTSVKNESFQKLAKFERASNLKSKLPEETIISKDRIIQLFEADHAIDKDDQGRTIVTKDGQVMKNDVLEPLSLEDVFASFVDAEGFVKKSGMGGGDGDGGGSTGKFSKYSDFKKWADKNNINPMSEEGQKELAARQSENFVYD